MGDVVNDLANTFTGRWALVVGAAVAVGLVLLIGRVWGQDLQGVAKDKQGQPQSAPLRAMLLGADQRASTSKATAALWTVVVVFMLATTMTIVLATGQSAQIPVGKLGENYLLLLGGPFAALVLAKGITVTRMKDGTLSKVAAADPVFKSSDLACNDAGQTDLVDFQFLLFNGLLVLYVLARFVTNPAEGLPDVPLELAGLTSVSALTYTANKAVASDTPTITGSTYDPATQTVAITGSHLGGANALVTFDTKSYQLAGQPTDKAISVHIVPPPNPGTYEVLVSVPAGTGWSRASTSVVVP
jgi:hypothetical protein